MPQHGGVVYFPPGHYLSATIAGRSNVTFDARKGRSASPLNGTLLEGLVDSVVANNSLFHAAQKMLIIDQGGHQNTTIRDNPGSPALPSQREAGSAKP